jgi:transcriptional regulator with XRE-family HTH domain
MIEFNTQGLKELREKKGLSLEKLARRMDCSYGKIHAISKGKSQPSLEDLNKMMHIFGGSVSIKKLLRY